MGRVCDPGHVEDPSSASTASSHPESNRNSGSPGTALPHCTGASPCPSRMVYRVVLQPIPGVVLRSARDRVSDLEPSRRAECRDRIHERPREPVGDDPRAESVVDSLGAWAAVIDGQPAHGGWA